MKIVLATNSLLPADKEGGPPYSNFYLAQALKAAGAEVRVVTTDRNGPERLNVIRDCWTERDGVQVYYATTRAGSWIRSPSYAQAVASAVSASDVCIMSGIFWNYTGLVAASACRKSRVPYLTMPRGLLSPWALRHKGLKKRLYWTLLAGRIARRSAAFIALARQERDDILAMHLDAPVHVVPNGAFVAEFDRVQARGAASVAGEAGYILFLGRIHSKKGLDILLPAFEQLAAMRTDALLVIAGTVDAAYRGPFESLLSSNAARDRIRLPGNVSGAAKAELLAGASVFVLTSYSEGLPVAVLEGLAAGLPAVVTPGCNLPEIAAAEAGIEVAPNAKATAEALARLISDPQLRIRMGTNARKLAIEHFSWDSVAQRVLDVCRLVTQPVAEAPRCAQSERERDGT